MRDKRQAISQPELFWYTRGNHWGFNILSMPATPQMESWYSFSRDLFTKLDVEADFSVAKDSILDKQHNTYFYRAVSFLDPELVDAFGRPIQHFMALIFPSAEADSALNQDWYERVLEYYRPVYRDQLHPISQSKLNAWLENPSANQLEGYLLDAISTHAPKGVPLDVVCSQKAWKHVQQTFLTQERRQDGIFSQLISKFSWNLGRLSSALNRVISQIGGFFKRIGSNP